MKKNHYLAKSNNRNFANHMDEVFLGGCLYHTCKLCSSYAHQDPDPVRVSSP